MNMKNKDIFDKLRNADDSVIEQLTELCEPVSKASDDRIFSKIEKKCSSYSLEFETDYADEVRGVDIYMRPKWFKSVMTAVICCLLVVGLFSGAFILKRNSAKNKEVQTDPQGISVPATDAQGRTVITIGFTGDIGYLTKRISSYNNSQKSYQLEVIDYTKKTGRNLGDAQKDYYKEELNMLKRDIVSGEAPDIIAVDSFNMLPLVKTGMFTDLYELMDGGTGNGRDDFFSNILDGFEIDGEIPVISTNFTINTAVAKTKFVGENAENWTIEQLIEKSRAISEDMMILKGEDNSSGDIFNFASKKIFDECIDFDESECNFNNDSLRKALAFAIEFPSDHQYSNQSQIRYPMLNDKALINEIQISDFGQGDANNIWLTFGEDDVTFVGFPSDEKNGAKTIFHLIYGIPENSENKEAAWKALSYILNCDHFSKAELIEKYNAKDPTDIDSVYSSYIGDDRETGKMITQERVDQLYNYIQTVKIYPYRDLELEGIIGEEAQYVLSGERTPDQCIDILNDRIGTYMAENE